ncbi:UBX domain-containing protein 10 [Peromyscus maniculatus bairdii]|uniref:UBX domain-containing protein 10 n=1 Tax=Peromyscus maniculatus bairdii TaxID=230844 RepID=A0A6J0DIX0_PERMB|nr:UBX domain-containing protein 10 [Peromyscus maniculatus bairdii]XP_042128098.1 UBX domain-containing protein 10 [Peromyscus maniculatus bairdii]
MATEAPVNLAPPERSTVVGTSADSFTWQPSPLRMHVIRPKSAKGRKRPNLHRPQGVGDGSPSVLSASPPPRSSGSSGSQKAGACAPVSPSPGAPDETPELLPQVLVGATSSLNKYPVLPSINRRSLEDGAVDTVARKASSLQLSSVQALYQEEACAAVKTSQEDSRAQVCALEKKFILRTKRQSSSGSSNMEEPTDQEPRLLLAIRSPSGQRFVRYFRPSDNLQTVLAVAEQKNKATYQHCSIETMEVPRRRFSDLTKSLQECGILHKSVLGISQEEGEG